MSDSYFKVPEESKLATVLLFSENLQATIGEECSLNSSWNNKKDKGLEKDTFAHK